MADSKITALTAISTVDPAADPLVIVDVSDTSMAASGTTKKATINQLLGASGTATLASATITGDLTVDTSTLKVDSANNRVGIGTATPAAVLHVVNGNVRLSDSAQVEFGGTTNSISGSNASNLIEIYTNNLRRNRIDSNGVATWSNVGGVAGDAMTLNSTGLGVGAAAGAFAEKFRVYGAYTLMDDGAFTGFLGKASSLGASGATTDFGIRSSNALIFLSGGATERMRIDSSGNVLVGTTSAGGNRLNVQTASGDCLMLLKAQAANTNFVIDYVSNYGNYTIRKSGAAVWDYGVISDSSVTPAFKIQNASSVGVQLVSGATAWTTLSDETMKDIIEPISNAVSKVGSLRSVIGKFKTDDSSKRRSFLIAQDVQSVLPEAVDVVGENNELGVRYTEVIPLLVAAIKELTARVQTLETR